MSLERTGCFGPCPVYMLTILGDGTVKYIGSLWVGVEGAREDKISPEQVAILVNQFLRHRFFELADTYDGGEKVEFRDGKYQRYGIGGGSETLVILSLELGQRRKRVFLRYRYPADLDHLAGLIDEVTQSKRWTTVKP